MISEKTVTLTVTKAPKEPKANGRFRAIWAATLTDCSWPITLVHAPRRNVRCRGEAYGQRRRAYD